MLLNFNMPRVAGQPVLPINCSSSGYSFCDCGGNVLLVDLSSFSV
jgi:hypothetical protein